MKSAKTEQTGYWQNWWIDEIYDINFFFLMKSINWGVGEIDEIENIDEIDIIDEIDEIYKSIYETHKKWKNKKNSQNRAKIQI